MLGNLLRSIYSSAKTPAPRMAEPFVAFITTVSAVRQCLSGESWSSKTASARLRVYLPARALAAQVPVVYVPPQVVATGNGLEEIGRARAVVVGKLPTTFILRYRNVAERLLEALDRIGERVPLFADLSDDYAAMGRVVGEPFFEHYQRTLARICVLTVPCDALAQRFAPIARKGISVIEDPWENPRAGLPRVRPEGPARLCWFGHLSEVNFDVVETGLQQIAARLQGMPVTLDVVAGHERHELVRGLGARLYERNPAFTTRFVPWSTEATWRAIEACDLVVLPQDTRGEWGSVKSHNRLVETIRGGRLAIASPIPSYQELAEYAWLGEDLGAGVAWALQYPEDACDRVARGQAYIAGRFSPEAIGRKWARTLGVPTGAG